MEQKTVFIGATGYDHYCTEGRKKLLDAGCCLIENQLGRPYTAEAVSYTHLTLPTICSV